MMIDRLLDDANEVMIAKINKGELSLENEDEKELLIAFLRANLTRSGKILSILEAFALLMYPDNMEREYINQFLNKVREFANTSNEKW